MNKNNKINSYIKKLKSDGYLIIDNLFNSKECDKYKSNLKKIYNKFKKNKLIEGEKYGQVIIRDLVMIDPNSFLNLIDNKILYKIAELMFNDEFILENIMASNSVNVNQEYKRIAHIDGHIPVDDVNNTTDLVAIICLDDFTKENGATKIWPKSHLSGVQIHKSKIKDKLIKKKNIYMKAKKGSVGFILGQTWHQIGRNLSEDSRWSIIIHYKRWWIKPSTDFTKCGNKIFQQLNDKQKKLFGFNCISPKFNLKNYNKNYKILRKSSKIPKEYKKTLIY